MSYRCGNCGKAYDGSVVGGIVMDPRPNRVVTEYRKATYERDHLDRPMDPRFGYEVAREKFVCKACLPLVEAKMPSSAVAA